MNDRLVINGRFRRQPMSGVQRAAAAIVERLRAPYAVVSPSGRGSGPLGHLWEQAVLPLAVGKSLLWSPCNAGPVTARRHVVTFHDAAVLDHPEWFSRRFADLYARLWPRLARTSKMVTVSEFSRQRLAERLSVRPEDIAVVPNGVDPKFTPASPDDIAVARAAYGLGDRPYFLALATIEPRKNLALVLRAWPQVRAAVPDALLVIAGAAGSREVFSSHGAPSAKDDDGVMAIGRAPEAQLPALISGARALLYPSLYEGFGLPVLEAMACGAPAVTTRRASLPEVGGEAALYVDAEDEDDLAALMVRLAEDDALVGGRRAAGLERARGFSWDSSARAMERIFEAHV